MIKELAVNIESEAKRLARIAEAYFADRAHEQYGDKLMEGRVSKKDLEIVLRDTMFDHGENILNLHTKENVQKIMNRAVKIVLGSKEKAAETFKRRESKPMGTVQRINAILKKAGRQEKLIRNPRGYYYLTDGEACWFSYSSIYVYKLEDTPKDFRYTLDAIKEIYKDAQKDGRINTIPDFDKYV